MVPVARLPDLCLLALFRQMTLKDRMVARKVCRRWDSLMFEANLNRRSLILLLGNPPWMRYFKVQFERALFGRRKCLKWLLKENGTAMFPVPSLTDWSSLKYDSLNQNLVDEIAATFVGTKELWVIISTPSGPQAYNLANLFDHWQMQLTSLKLIENQYQEEYSATRLYKSINNLSSLKHLTLNLQSLPFYDLPVIAQLKELHFFVSRSTPGDFSRLLKNYGEDNKSLERIVYETLESGPYYLDHFNSLSERLRGCFTCFNLLDSLPSDPRPFYPDEGLCGRFQSLTSLYVIPLHVTLRDIFTQLAKLPQLLHIYLTLRSNTITEEQDDVLHIFPQLQSVRALDLEVVNMVSHQDLARVKLYWTMPNLEVIQCDFPQYAFCGECGNLRYAHRECIRRIFRSLKSKCAKLRLIKYNLERWFGTAEELLSE